MNTNDWIALGFLILAGYSSACMDDWQFAHKIPRWPYTWLNAAGLQDGKRYLGFWVEDAWHVPKNFLLISISGVVYFAHIGGLATEYYLLAGPVIGIAFIFFFHVVFGVGVYLWGK